MAVDLGKVAKQKNLRYFLISYTDLFGVARSKLVPAAAIGQMQKDGAGFAGFSTYLDMTPADADMFAMPDTDSLTVLPWNREVAWLAADLHMGGKAVEASPRIMLKRQVERAAKKGYRLKTGVECEYFLLQPDGSAIADERDVHDKPCYDQQALMRRYAVITEICDGMLELGWGPYQNDHEDANGQFEMNWNYDDALITADRHQFFKFMVRSIAEKHGLRATFMPKPFRNLTGNGCHAHASVWDKTGAKNLFHDPKGELGIAKLGYHFLGGVLHNAEALCSFFNPTINSYKRINAPVTASGATWSPNTISYGGNNRTHMVRIPDAGRLEFRLMDGAANPYLLQAVLLAAGLDGMVMERDPGKRLDINMYEHRRESEYKRLKVRRLPLNLLDALRFTDKSKMLREAFGDAVIESYIKLKAREWNDFCGHLTEWERSHTLDC
jgi:glutamine synthetase